MTLSDFVFLKFNFQYEVQSHERMTVNLVVRVQPKPHRLEAAEPASYASPQEHKFHSANPTLPTEPLERDVCWKSRAARVTSPSFPLGIHSPSTWRRCLTRHASGLVKSACRSGPKSSVWEREEMTELSSFFSSSWELLSLSLTGGLTISSGLSAVVIRQRKREAPPTRNQINARCFFR